MMSEVGYRDWLGKEVRELPEVREILQYMKNITFRKKVFFGYDKDDAMDHIASINQMYETAMRKLQKRSEKDIEKLRQELEQQKKQVAQLTSSYQGEKEKLSRLESEREVERTEYLQMAQVMEQIAKAQQGILDQARQEADQILRDSYDKAVGERQRASEEAQEMIETANRQVYKKQKQADELRSLCEMLKSEYHMRMVKAQDEIRKLKESMDGFTAQLGASDKKIEEEMADLSRIAEVKNGKADNGVSFAFEKERPEEKRQPKLVSFGGGYAKSE
ncbi:hypothetical protein [Anaerotruncus colihominis]|uniref:hypothetical protein n=1 Tax=Anaerotruncus colihominis TaxID=169435 RepID=UPI001896C8AD|nr:hypothetical protein [Anaerotruncus colihominis]